MARRGGVMAEAKALTTPEEELSALCRRYPEVEAVERLARAGYLQTLHAIGQYEGLELPRYEPLQLMALKMAAYQLAIHLLRPSEDALAAWRDVVGPGRVANALTWSEAPVLDLPCGNGKSQTGQGTVVASVELFTKGELGEDYPGVLFVLDSTEELEATHQAMARALEEKGIPARQWLGVFHTLQGKAITTVKRENCWRYPVLLICSQQLQARAKEVRRDPSAVGAKPFLSLGNGKQRQLVIKDETLHTTEAHVIDSKLIENACYSLCHNPTTALQTKLHGMTSFQKFLVDLEQSIRQTVIDLGDQEQWAVRTCEVPPMDEAVSQQAKVLTKKLCKSHRDIAKCVEILGEIGSVIDLEVAAHKQGDKSIVVCKSIQSWPKEIQNVVTLDANWSADLLSKASNRYTRSRLLDVIAASPSELKDMSRLRVHLAKGACGRDAMLDAKKRRSLGKAIVKEVSRIHSTTREKCLIFTFLPDYSDGRIVNHQVWMRDWLIRAGIPRDEICLERDELKPSHRVAIETWGRHKSTNAYVDFGNVLMLGILQEPALGLLMHGWSESGSSDDGVKALPWDVNEIRRSQMVCDFIQALFRGSARRTEYGKCLPMNVFAQVWDPARDINAFIEMSRQILGNFQLVEWPGVGQPLFGTAAGKQGVRHADIEDVVLQLLAKAEPGEDGRQVVSFMAAKQEWLRRTGKTISNPTWQKRRARVSEELEKRGVVVEGRSWVRSGAVETA